MTPGERLRQLRKEHHMTQEQLGEIIGVQKAAIQKYEKGTVQNIKRASLLKLAKALETTPEYILGWEAPENIVSAGNVKMIQVPIIGKVAAGISCFAQSDIVGYENIPENDISPDDQYAFLQVKGDSMYPVFMEGDLVLIRAQSSVDSGSYAVVTIDNEDGVVKKVVYGNDFIELQSINPMYPPRRFENDEVLRIRVLGVVKEIKRKF